MTDDMKIRRPMTEDERLAELARIREWDPSVAEKLDGISKHCELLSRARHESLTRERLGFECVRRSTHLANGPGWLDAIDPLMVDNAPALELRAHPDGDPILFVVDLRFDPPAVVAEIDFRAGAGDPDLRKATYKQRVWLLARLALRAEV